MTARQQKALTALLTHSTHKEAAKAAGISDRQLRSYLKDPEFKKEYRARLDLVLDEATTAAKRAMTPAVKTLVEIASDRKKADTTRVLAARAILDAGLRLNDAMDVSDRLTALEKYAEKSQGD